MAKVKFELGEIGVSGLDISAGVIKSDFLRQLDGAKGVKVYAAMRDNSPVIGAVLFAIRMLLKNVTWFAEPAAPEKIDIEAAEFIDTALDDMTNGFGQVVEEALSMVVFGWSLHETIYKIRKSDSSKYPDNKIGWERFAHRAQETLEKWIVDPATRSVVGMQQRDPVLSKAYDIMLHKAVLVRAAQHRGSPEGRSLLRNAYRPWYLLTNIEDQEAIGIERDMTGIPIARIPAECLSDAASDDKKAIATQFKEVVQNLRKDEQAGIVIPSDRDAKGNLLFEIDFIKSSGSNTIDTSKPIQRYNTQILMTLLADFLQLGHEKVGSFALSSDKTNMFGAALAGIASIIADDFTKQAIEPLLRLNNMPGCARLAHSDVEKLNPETLATVISNLARAGMIFDDADTETYMRNQLGLPAREDMDDTTPPDDTA